MAKKKDFSIKATTSINKFFSITDEEDEIINPLKVINDINDENNINTANNTNDTNIENNTDNTNTENNTDNENIANDTITGNAYHNLTLSIPIKYRQILADESWKQKKNVTQYINDLIAEDSKKEHNIETNKSIEFKKKTKGKEYYRFIVKTPYMEFLKEVSWKQRKTITEYITSIIDNAKKD